MENLRIYVSSRSLVFSSVLLLSCTFLFYFLFTYFLFIPYFYLFISSVFLSFLIVRHHQRRLLFVFDLLLFTFIYLESNSGFGVLSFLSIFSNFFDTFNNFSNSFIAFSKFINSKALFKSINIKKSNDLFLLGCE